MNLANRPPLGLKPAKAKPNPAYLRAIHDLPCCICEAWGEVQRTQTTAHHVICDRFSGAKTPDEMAIPLCESHHQTGKLAIHAGKETWVAKYGNDFGYTPATQDRLAHLLVTP